MLFFQNDILLNVRITKEQKMDIIIQHTINYTLDELKEKVKLKNEINEYDNRPNNLIWVRKDWHGKIPTK